MPKDTSKFEIGHGLNVLLLSWFNKNILEKYKARKEKFEDLSNLIDWNINLEGYNNE